MTLSDDLVIAYVDGETDVATTAHIEAQAMADPGLAARIAGHRRLRQQMGSMFAGALEEPVPRQLIEAVGIQPSVVDLATMRARRRVPAWVLGTGMAACLVLGLGIGAQVRGSGPITPDMYARGALATSLDRQLASQAQSGKAVRIGVSFKASDGRFCRTFQVHAKANVAGLACRDPSAWRVVAAAPDAGTDTTFRTAGSAPIAILQAAQSMMAGEAFDAQAEAQAKAHGWR